MITMPCIGVGWEAGAGNHTISSVQVTVTRDYRLHTSFKNIYTVPGPIFYSWSCTWLFFYFCFFNGDTRDPVPTISLSHSCFSVRNWVDVWLISKNEWAYSYIPVFMKAIHDPAKVLNGWIEAEYVLIDSSKLHSFVTCSVIRTDQFFYIVHRSPLCIQLFYRQYLLQTMDPE